MKQLMIALLPPTLIALVVCAGLCLPQPPRASSMPSSGMRAPLLSQIIEQERARNGLPKGLIEAIITVESNWDETAYNPETDSECAQSGRSDCGSGGLMGVVARWHGKSKNFADNIRRGAKYLGKCYRRAGSEWGAARRYNGKGRAAEIYANKVIKEFQIWKRLAG